MIVDGLTYWVQQCIRVKCPDCGVDLVMGPLVANCNAEHGVGLGAHIDNPPPGITSDASDFLSERSRLAGMTSQEV